MGHTHRNREIRYVFSERKQIKKKENPFSIFWDDYSSKYPAEFIQNNPPFIFQTPSLGIAREKDRNWGAFRLIEIRKNKIANIQVKYLSRLKL